MICPELPSPGLLLSSSSRSSPWTISCLKTPYPWLNLKRIYLNFCYCMPFGNTEREKQLSQFSVGCLTYLLTFDLRLIFETNIAIAHGISCVWRAPLHHTGSSSHPLSAFLKTLQGLPTSHITSTVSEIILDIPSGFGANTIRILLSFRRPPNFLFWKKFRPTETLN